MATVPNIALLQSNAAAFSGSSFNITPANNISSGSGMYIEFVQGTTSTNFVSSISGGGGTWIRLATKAGTVSAFEVWYNQNMTAGAATISVTLSGTLTGIYAYGELSGIASTSSLDTSSSSGVIATTNSASYTLASGNTGTLAQEVELVLCFNACFGAAIGASNSTPTGYTQAATAGSAGQHIYFDYKIHAGAVSTESASVPGGGSSAVDAYAFVACFKAVSGVIQQRNLVTAGGPNTSITIGAPRPGNFQLLATNNASGGPGTVTQTNAPWIKLFSIPGTNSTTDLWYSLNASASAGTTITMGTSCVFQYQEFYGIATSNPVDKTVTTNTACTSTSTTAVSGTTLATTLAPELAICAMGTVYNNVSGNTTAPTNGYAILANTTAGGAEVAVLFKILTATGTTSTGATISPTTTPNTYQTILATFAQTSLGGSKSFLSSCGAGN